MSAKHTPGPWVASGVGALWGVWFNDGRGRLAALDRTRDGHEPFRAATEADARLIAAAPELLAALKFALEILHEADARLGYHPDSLGAIEMEEAITGARAAIARATGEAG